ncbi:MAG: hypothetical protein IPN29_21840 [Saprospiraceae bacterium]|nr:hypothetical protein [Saprospiraceae bacterium]
MKKTFNFRFYLLALALGLTFTSCQDADPYENLDGTFNLTTAYADGVKTSPVGGTITFNADKTGDLDIDYVVATTQASLTGNFEYTATADLITLNPGASDETVWKRKIDESKKQQIEFNQAIGGKNYTILLEFTK